MANERQELDRLRKVKRLRELESREVQSDNIPDSNLGVPSNNSAIQQPIQQAVTAPQKTIGQNVGEFFTGSDRQTRATQELPEIGQGGLLSGEDGAKTAAITPALLTATNPQELGQILQSNFENIGITSDEKGNLIANNNQTGAKVVLNQPGVSQFDILQGLGVAASFTPAGRVAGAAKLGAAAGATSAGIEALQALSGGEFDASQVAIDAVTAGVLDKAFEVAKSSGRSIREVLRDDAKIDPDQILKSFEPQGFSSKKFGSDRVSFGKKDSAQQNIQKASQADLTPEALAKIRQAEAQGIQLSKAQATGDRAASDAEQTLLKSFTTKEGIEAQQFADKQQEQLKGAAEAFTDKFGGSAKFKEALGESVEDTARGKGELIQDALTGQKELGRKEVSDLYDIAGDTVGEPIPLDNSSIVSTADELINKLVVTADVEKTIDSALAKFGLLGDKAEQVTRNKFRVTDGEKNIEIIGDITPLTLNNANDFRKALNQAVGGDLSGAAKSIVRELDRQTAAAIESGASSGRTEAFKSATAAAAKQIDTFKAKDVIDDLVSFKGGTSTPKVDPETVINKIVKGDKAVTNIRKLKKVLLENSTPETKKAWRSIQAEAVGDILGQAINKDTLEISGARLNSAIKKSKPEALQELLGRKQFAELKRLQSTIGSATIPPPGTTNPSGTFTKFLNMSERLGNAAGLGQFNFGSLVVAAGKKGSELKARKATLDGLVNTKIIKLKKDNPSMNKSALEKAAKTLAFLELRELDKENK